MSIVAIVGGPSTVSQASGGKVTAFNNLSTAPQTVANANQARRKITFHNPGTADCYVAPALAAALANGALSALTPSTVALGGCFIVFQNGGTLVVEGECQGAWQAFSASGAGNSLTVMDSNV